MDWSLPVRVACERFPATTALVRGERRITYGELGVRIDGLAAGFDRLGVRSAPVASILLNEPEAVEVYMALARAGALSVPVNVRLTEDEKAYVLEDSGARVLVADPAFAAEALRLKLAPAARSRVLFHLGRDLCANLSGDILDGPLVADVIDDLTSQLLPESLSSQR